MLVALVDFYVDPADREVALKHLLEEASAVRAMTGCKTFRPYGDPADTSLVGIVHEWESEADFAAYLRSDGFKEIGALVRPMMTAEPSSRRYLATLSES